MMRAFFAYAGGLKKESLQNPDSLETLNGGSLYRVGKRPISKLVLEMRRFCILEESDS
jgi:hypothetical protein